MTRIQFSVPPVKKPSEQQQRCNTGTGLYLKNFWSTHQFTWLNNHKLIQVITSWREKFMFKSWGDNFYKYSELIVLSSEKVSQNWILFVSDTKGRNNKLEKSWLKVQQVSLICCVINILQKKLLMSFSICYSFILHVECKIILRQSIFECLNFLG